MRTRCACTLSVSLFHTFTLVTNDRAVFLLVLDRDIQQMDKLPRAEYINVGKVRRFYKESELKQLVLLRDNTTNEIKAISIAPFPPLSTLHP